MTYSFKEFTISTFRKHEGTWTWRARSIGHTALFDAPWNADIGTLYEFGKQSLGTAGK